MKIHLSLIMVSSLAFTLNACSDSSFEADANKGPALPASGSKAGEGSGDSVDPGSSSGTLTPDDEKNLKNCETVWGKDAPARTSENVRVIHSSISVGNAGTVISDLKATEKPEFVIIYSAIAVGSEPEWKLLNPNGYYCIVSSINVGSSLSVTLNKSAHIAESKQSLNVGSVVDENVGVSGINVGSEIKVVRQ